jgi:hypothetical protein
MRRLRDFQPVNVHGTRETVSARVVSLHGDQVVLDPAQSPEAFEAAEPALLAFEHAGRMITLSGTASTDPRSGLLRFLCTDGVRLPDQRRHERLAIPLPATVASFEPATNRGGRPVSTQVVDISAGGVLLALDGLDGILRVTIDIPGAPVPVVAVAHVIRSGVPGTALMFRTIAEEDRALIQAFVGSVKQALARRFAAAAAR